MIESPWKEGIVKYKLERLVLSSLDYCFVVRSNCILDLLWVANQYQKMSPTNKTKNGAMLSCHLTKFQYFKISKLLLFCFFLNEKTFFCQVFQKIFLLFCSKIKLLNRAVKSRLSVISFLPTISWQTTVIFFLKFIHFAKILRSQTACFDIVIILYKGSG